MDNNVFSFDDVDMLEVELIKDFPVVRETLSRMGIKNSKKMCFYPSVYCVQHEGKYFLIHFKELFKAIGNNSTYNDIDSMRLRTIAFFLEKWGIVKVKEKINSILKEKIHILRRSERDLYEIIHKFQFRNTIEIRDVGEL